MLSRTSRIKAPDPQALATSPPAHSGEGLLARILTAKREECALLRCDLRGVREQAREQDPPRGFRQSLLQHLARGEAALICESKRASPSAGVLRAYGSPAETAQGLERGGAACLSILTDRAWFHAQPDDLQQARAATRLPVLRKDFLIDPVQVWQARAMGADCVLLVMRLLEASQAQEMEALAMELGMDVLVEVHRQEELEIAISTLQATMIGVNARDLQSLSIDLPRAAALVSRVPADRLAVASSGLRAPADLLSFLAARSQSLAFLIGEAIMRSDDPALSVAAYAQTARRVGQRQPA